MFSELEILQEKIREARHNELIGFGLLVLGLAVTFAGLFLGTIQETTPILGAYVISHPYASMALTITLLGLLMTILGSVFVTYSATNRSQNMKELEMIPCPKCGRRVEDEMKFCPYCGTQILNPSHATKALAQPTLTISGK